MYRSLTALLHQKILAIINRIFAKIQSMMAKFFHGCVNAVAQKR